MMSHRDVVSLLTRTMELRAVRSSIELPAGTISQTGKREVIAVELGPDGTSTRVHYNSADKITAAVVDTYASGEKSTITAKEVRLDFTGAVNATSDSGVTINGRRYAFSVTATVPQVSASLVTVPIAGTGAVTVANALVSVLNSYGLAGIVAATTDPDVVKLTSLRDFNTKVDLTNVSTIAAAAFRGGVASFSVTTPPGADCAANDTTVVTFDNYNLPNGLATLGGPTVTVEVT
jgi:hypothetical protein